MIIGYISRPLTPAISDDCQYLHTGCPQAVYPHQFGCYLPSSTEDIGPLSGGQVCLFLMELIIL